MKYLVQIQIHTYFILTHSLTHNFHVTPTLTSLFLTVEAHSHTMLSYIFSTSLTSLYVSPHTQLASRSCLFILLLSLLSPLIQASWQVRGVSLIFSKLGWFFLRKIWRWRLLEGEKSGKRGEKRRRRFFGPQFAGLRLDRSIQRW